MDIINFEAYLKKMCIYLILLAICRLNSIAYIEVHHADPPPMGVLNTPTAPSIKERQNKFLKRESLPAIATIENASLNHLFPNTFDFHKCRKSIDKNEIMHKIITV